MKRIVLLVAFLFLFILPVNADTMPYLSSDISTDAIGMYQMPKNIVIYSSPDINSDILYEAKWDYKTFDSEYGSSEKIFSVFVQAKELAYVQVTDYQDEWAEIIYDKYSGTKGWIKTEELRFMNWRSFYNLYARKYGLYLLKGSPESIKNLHSATSDESQIIHKMEKPKKIKFTVVKGNWALVTSIEHNLGISGYLKWRGDSGEIYAFPAIK